MRKQHANNVQFDDDDDDDGDDDGDGGDDDDDDDDGGDDDGDASTNELSQRIATVLSARDKTGRLDSHGLQEVGAPYYIIDWSTCMHTQIL